MRLIGRQRLGFYPIPLPEAERIRKFLTFPDNHYCALDPCIGDGAAFAETMQESCLRLMGKKLLVSLAMEGKFSSEGLQAMNDEDDILMAMARELVTEKGIGERADAVWATLQKQQEDILGTRATEDSETMAEQAVAAIPLIEPGSTQVDQWPAVKSPLESPARRNSPPSTSAMPGEQLTLF